MSYIIYADLESFIRKIDGCKNYSEKSSITKIGKRVPFGYSISTIWTFDGTGNKHNIYKGEDCMKTFCESLRDHAMKIINLKNKKMMVLANEEQESRLKSKICYICKRKFIEKFAGDKLHSKVRGNCHFTGKS